MRKALPLVIALIILVIIAGFLSLRGKRGIRAKEVITLKGEPLAFIIKEKSDSVVLKKKGENWFVLKDNFEVKADSFQIQNLLNKIESLNGDLISKNPEKFSIYEVTEDKAISLKIITERDTEVIYIGKRGPDFSTCYVKPQDKDRVYLIQVNLRPIMKVDLKRWRNKKILYFDPDNVYRLVYEYPKDTFEFIKSDTGIISPQIAELDTQAVKSVLRSLSRFSAYEFADTVSEEEAGFKNPKLTLRIEFVDGSEAQVIVGKKKDEYKYYVKRVGDNSVYLPSKYVVERFMKKRADFVKKEKKEEVKKDKK